MRLPVMLLALSLPLPLLAQTPVTIRQSVWSQVVTYPAVLAPEPAFQSEISNGFFIVEYVAADESVEHWTQMQTLTGHRQAAPEAALAAARAEEVAVNFLDGYRSACATEVDALPLAIAPVPGAQGAFAAYLGCADVLGQSRSEEMVIVILVGERDTYTLQWAERGAARPALSRDDFPRWQPRFEILAQVSLCTPQPGEAAPYPSCP